MNGDDFWEEEEFRDIPEETTAKTAQELAIMHMQNGVAPPPLARPMGPTPGAVQHTESYDEQNGSIDLVVDEEEVDDSTTLSDARLRLAQGELYSVIMKHDLFQGMDTDPRAIKNVQREIRKFAKERMEVMLGMRQEAAPVQLIEGASPFNPMEIEILKRLASKATNGATETAEAATFATPKKAVLNPISGGSKPAAPKLPSAPAAPVRRAEVTQAARENKEKVLTGKQLHEMNETERNQYLENKQREIAKTQAERKVAKSASAVPQASYEQEEAMYARRFEESGKAKGTVKTILALMEKQKGSK
jgi:hypothetical protein